MTVYNYILYIALYATTIMPVKVINGNFEGSTKERGRNNKLLLKNNCYDNTQRQLLIHNSQQREEVVVFSCSLNLAKFHTAVRREIY